MRRSCADSSQVRIRSRLIQPRGQARCTVDVFSTMLTASRRLQCLVQESTQAPRVRKAYCHFACQSCVYGRFIRVRRSARAINGNGHTCNQWGGDDAVVRRDRRTPHDPMPSRRRGLRLIRAHDPNHHTLRQPAIAALLWSGGEPVAPLRCSGSRGAPPPARFPGSRDAYRRGNFSSPVHGKQNCSKDGTVHGGLRDAATN